MEALEGQRMGIQGVVSAGTRLSFPRERGSQLPMRSIRTKKKERNYRSTTLIADRTDN